MIRLYRLRAVLSPSSTNRWIPRMQQETHRWTRQSSTASPPSAHTSTSSKNASDERTTHHPTYSADNTPGARPVRPEMTLTPRSRRPYPHRIMTRNGAGPYEAVGIPLPHYPKRKSPYKRTTAVIEALGQEEALRMKQAGRAVLASKLPKPFSGQIVRIAYTQSLAKEEPILYFKGIVISFRSRGLGSTVILRNVVEGVPIERGFPLYSPLVKDVEVLDYRKTRRHKMYFLRDRPERESIFPGATSKPDVE